MTDVDELLRRDGEQWRATVTAVPQIDWAALPSRRRALKSSWLLVPAAAAVVVLAIVVPSMLGGRSSLPAPAHRPSPSPTAKPLDGPASFIALNRYGVTQIDARTGETRGMSTTESGRHPTALAVADDGNVGYATYSEPGCNVRVTRYRWTSANNAEATDAAMVAGAKADAIGISPDGHLLAIAVVPCVAPTEAVRADDVDDLVVVDLDSHRQRRWTGYPDVSFLSAFQWGPDNKTLSYVVTPCCGGGSEGPRLLDTASPGTSYVKPLALPVPEEIGRGVVLWYGGRLAVIVDTEIRALSRSGRIGDVLADGLPSDVASVDTDRTGRHLLVTTVNGKLYRWDDGTLTRLPGTWVDAGW